MRYLATLSASDEMTDEDTSENEAECTVFAETDPHQESAIPSQNFKDVPSRYKEANCGNRIFWLFVFNDYDPDPLEIHSLPPCSGNVANLETIAAFRYGGLLTGLPQIFAASVRRIRETKKLIFGSDIPFPGTSFLSNYKNYVLYLALREQLNKLNTAFCSCSKCQSVMSGFLYNYRVSLNGLLCGKVRGPSQINRSFVRWIHLHFGFFSHLCVKGIEAKWRIQGFRVYRFVPIPYVTVLRIGLCYRQESQQVLFHITREPDKQ